MVTLPAGELIIELEIKGSRSAYAAGVLESNEVNWTRCTHVDTRMVDVDPANPEKGKRRVHVVVVDGNRGEYAEVDALRPQAPSNPLAAFSTEELEMELAQRRRTA